MQFTGGNAGVLPVQGGTEESRRSQTEVIEFQHKVTEAKGDKLYTAHVVSIETTGNLLACCAETRARVIATIAMALGKWSLAFKTEHFTFNHLLEVVT